jgi:hypothetical protein
LGAGELGGGKASSLDDSQGHGGKSRMRRAHRAAAAATKMNNWTGVGASRAELLRGVCEWLSGQAAMAHHHWNQAIEIAEKESGALAYDAAVAKFLLGKHRLASATLYQWTELVKADAHFAKLGLGARMELEAVRAELAHRRGARPKNAVPGKDIVGVPPAFPHTREFDAPRSIKRPPAAIQETLHWGRRSLEAVKRRLHHERLLPVYHRHEEADGTGTTIDVLVSKRQSLAKAVVVAESHLASLGAEIHSALSTGCEERRPNSAMGFDMERKLVKLIDEISVHARDLGAIAEKQKNMRLEDLERKQNVERSMRGEIGGSEGVGGGGGGGGGLYSSLDLNENGTGSPLPQEVSLAGQRRRQHHHPQNDGGGGGGGVGGGRSRGSREQVFPAKKRDKRNESGSQPSLPENVKGAELLMLLKSQLFQGAREGKLAKVTQVVGTKLMDVASSKDAEGNTALMIAVQNAHLDVAEYIAARGRDAIVNAQNLEGNTALHYAAGNKPIETMLQSYGANPSLRNMYGLLPSNGCAPKCFADFAALLE